MRLTYNGLLCANRAVNKLIDKDLPFEVAYNLRHFLLDAQKWVAEFKKRETETLIKYANKNEDGEVITQEKEGSLFPEITDENKKKFFQEMDVILQAEIPFEFDDDYMVEKKDLSEITLSIQDIEDLWSLLKDREE